MVGLVRRLRARGGRSRDHVARRRTRPDRYSTKACGGLPGGSCRSGPVVKRSLSGSGPLLGRRRFLQQLMLGMAPIAGLQVGQDSLAGRGATGTLRDPAAIGRPRQPTAVKENDAELQAIEQRLACTCGCTLAIFTRPTTDFTCTYSPA